MYSDMSDERRNFPRVEAPVFVEPAGLFSARRRVVDIGPGGFRIYSDVEPKIGERIVAELFLPDQSSVKCTCRVAWVQSLDDGPAAFDVGVEILDGDAEGLARLKDVVPDTP